MSATTEPIAEAALALDDPATLARAARIVRAALERRNSRPLATKRRPSTAPVDNRPPARGGRRAA